MLQRRFSTTFSYLQHLFSLSYKRNQSNIDRFYPTVCKLFLIVFFCFFFQFCTNHETSDKNKFPTFVRTRPPDTQISKSVVSVLKAFNWTKVNFFYDIVIEKKFFPFLNKSYFMGGLQVTFMYMNSSLVDFSKMSTIGMTILSSLENNGITVNFLRCWKDPYYLMKNVENPFNEIIKDTYRETRSK